jgi:hypothetical protein
MELKNLDINHILHLDVHSTEVNKWMEVCGLTKAINAATFEPSKESILESFIRQYPPTQHRYDYYNCISVITFGILFTNREKILESDITLDKFKDLLLNTTSFYYDFLNDHFKKSFIDAMEEDHNIHYLVTHTVNNIVDKNSNAWLKIKSEYDFLKLNSDLAENMEKKSIGKNKL